MDQKICFDTIIKNITEHPESAQFLIQRPVGTGKTFFYKTLCNYLRAQKKIVLCVASSGIAALFLPGRMISHSRFKIPLIVNEDSICRFTGSFYLYEVLKQTSLIIWNEVFMQNKHCFAAVYRTLSDLLENQNLFEGIPVVFGGDFVQILPVVKHGNQDSIVNANIQ